MSQTITIAAAQSFITTDIAANGRHIREMMDRARAGGARVVLFPEGALSGYVKAQIRDWAQVDWALLRGELEAIAAHCRALGIWAVVGSAHRLGELHRPHNSLYVISENGVLVGRYDKRLLSNTEVNDWYAPGREPVVFEVDGYRFGMALCIEIQFPDLFAEYERLDVDCVLFSAYGIETEIKGRAHAGVNNLWFASSTPAQLAGQEPAMVFDPDGRIVATCAAVAEAALCFATLDRAAPELDIALTKARPWRRKAREGGIYRERMVDDPRSRDTSAF